MAKIQVLTQADAQPLELDSGMRIYDIYCQYPDAFTTHPQGYFPIAVTVNNYLMALSDRLNVSCTLNLIYADSATGGDVYRRSLIFLLGAAWNFCYPNQQLQISHSINYFYYFYIKADNKELTLQKSSDEQRYFMSQEQVDTISATLAQLVEKDLPIMSYKSYNNSQAMKIFESQQMPHAVQLLQQQNKTSVLLSQCILQENQSYFQIAHSPLAPSTSHLKYHKLHLENGMLVLAYPSTSHPHTVPYFKHNEAFSSIYEEYGRWARVMGIQSIGQLNEINRSDKFKSYVQICESRQNQMLATVCELILAGVKSQSCPMTYTEMVSAVKQKRSKSIVVGNIKNYVDTIKLVVISGPSSSGKTTFAKKLQQNLTIMGRIPLVVSMDNYFVNRVDTPTDETGKYDFEHIDALDLDLFTNHLKRLLNGEAIQSPIYDFKTGKRAEKTQLISLPARGIVIIEGIHALNPLVTHSIPIENKFGIFIQPLPCIVLDDRTRLSTRDYRLFRRIIRDRKYRNCSAAHTIELFDNVKRGEDRWVFPNQQRADIYFDTALDYELLILSTYVTPLLHEIDPTSSSYTEGRRLLQFLKWVQGANQDFVPKYSLLREFIGGSAFNYD